MSRYKQFTCGQRYQIEGLLKAELSQTQIALIVGVHKSTISRELRRNKGQRDYRPRQAQIWCNERKQSKAVSRFVLSDWILIERLLEQQWSHEQISLWLNVQDRLNNRPRKCLGIKTPNQLLFGIDPPVALGL